MAVHKRCCNKILSKCEGNAESSQSTIVSNDFAHFKAAKTKIPASGYAGQFVKFTRNLTIFNGVFFWARAREFQFQ